MNNFIFEFLIALRNIHKIIHGYRVKLNRIVLVRYIGLGVRMCRRDWLRLIQGFGKLSLLIKCVRRSFIVNYLSSLLIAGEIPAICLKEKTLRNQDHKHADLIFKKTCFSDTHIHT